MCLLQHPYKMKSSLNTIYSMKNCLFMFTCYLQIKQRINDGRTNDLNNFIAAGRRALPANQVINLCEIKKRKSNLIPFIMNRVALNR